MLVVGEGGREGNREVGEGKKGGRNEGGIRREERGRRKKGVGRRR
jgi:hypothetical protein